MGLWGPSLREPPGDRDAAPSALGAVRRQCRLRRRAFDRPRPLAHGRQGRRGSQPFSRHGRLRRRAVRHPDASRPSTWRSTAPRPRAEAVCRGGWPRSIASWSTLSGDAIRPASSPKPRPWRTTSATAHVPFHAILNYDGQLSGQNGLARALGERAVRPLRATARCQVASRTRPAPSGDPVALSFEALRESYRASSPALDSDRELAPGRTTSPTRPQNDRYDDALLLAALRARGRTLAERGSRRRHSVWRRCGWEAWQEAGRPELPAFRFAYVRRGAKLVLVSLDGGAATSLDDAVARGLMPNLAAIRAGGRERPRADERCRQRRPLATRRCSPAPGRTATASPASTCRARALRSSLHAAASPRRC